MNPRELLLSALVMVGVCCTASAEQKGKHTSLCAIQAAPQSYLHKRVEVQANIFVGAMGTLVDGRCVFPVALGDDYEMLHRRFSVRHDAQWKQMMTFLFTPPPKNCATNARIVRANITGVVERIPATGTIPPSEIGLHLVIVSVSGVQRVPPKCDADTAN